MKSTTYFFAPFMRSAGKIPTKKCSFDSTWTPLPGIERKCHAGPDLAFACTYAIASLHITTKL